MKTTTIINKDNGLTAVTLPDSRYPAIGQDLEFETAQMKSLYLALGKKLSEMYLAELTLAMDNGLQVEDLIAH